MKVDYIALSIPIFFLLIGVELIYSFITKIRLYRINDSLTNISLGIGQQVTGVFMKTALFFGYLYLYENYRLFSIESTLLTWIILFFGVDFFYYWFHRMSHEVNALWAAHIVHHQSEDYNFSVALRQSWFQSAFSWVFYLPLAFLGFDPVMFLTVSSFNTLYQFWIHTKMIGKMGIFEWFLNTPSHHRVHHGSDPQYIDKNHGGTLIIWDRLFGTFQKEITEPNYGITNQLNSWNPVWANIHYWVWLWKCAANTTGIKNKIHVFLTHPGWNSSLEKTAPENFHQHQAPVKYDSAAGKSTTFYIFLHFVLVLLTATLFLFMQKEFDAIQLAIISSMIIYSLVCFGGILESRSWWMKAEVTRLLLLPVTSVFFLNESYFNILSIVTILLSVLSFLVIQLVLVRRTKNISTPSA